MCNRQAKRLYPGLDLEKDGSWRFRYHGQSFLMRVRKHVDTGTFDVTAIWSEARQCEVPIRTLIPRNRWEALLAGELSDSIPAARHAAEREIERWLQGDSRARQLRSA